MIELYKNIKKLREQSGMSQDELAKLTGYTNRSSIAKIEKGEVDLTRSKIIAFAEAFCVAPGDLMGWDEDKIGAPNKENTPRILEYYNRLNDIGKHEAEKRVEELTHLPKYIKEEDYNIVNAAHAIDGASEEDKQYDEKIMDDKNF